LLHIARFEGNTNDFGFLGAAKIFGCSLSNAFVKSMSGLSLDLFFVLFIISESPDEVGTASKSR